MWLITTELLDQELTKSAELSEVSGGKDHLERQIEEIKRALEIKRAFKTGP